jgi:benzoate/toluate 1,2-dioxygenase subunit alpha
MNAYSPSDLKALVEEERIHRKAFVDPDIFRMEMERIFHRTWVYVGHVSQVPAPGDFLCTRIGQQPVLMVRHSDGNVRVLYNRCAHRGARVVNEECGNAKRFQCMYHGWIYRTDGSLAGLPMQSDEAADGFNFDNPDLGMRPATQVDQIHGFVFANLSPDRPGLLDYIGEARHAIDEFVEAAPDGEVEIAGGCHRYEYKGNWKHQLENLTDTYHVIATHASTVDPDGKQFKRRSGTDGAEARFYDDKKRPVILDIGVSVYPNGHSSTESMFPEAQTGGIWEEYRKVLAAKRGAERADELLKQKIHNLTIFPTFDLLVVQNAIRIIYPIAVDRTEVRIYPIRMKGAPEAIFREQVQYVNLTHSASSFVQTDDLEAFDRIQVGLGAEAQDWVLATRGRKRERFDNRGIGHGNKTTEIGLRSMHQTWLGLMCAE